MVLVTIGPVMYSTAPSQKVVSLNPPTQLYRGTLLIRNSAPLGPYSRTMLGALRWS